MQTRLADWIKDTPRGLEADAILRNCVHCGFCIATCPTYKLLGDELDGPRGRIYLMKQMLEGSPVDAAHPAAPGPLPHLPRVRDHLPVGRASTAGWWTSAARSSRRRCRARRRTGCGAGCSLRALRGAGSSPRRWRSGGCAAAAAGARSRGAFPLRREPGAWPAGAPRAAHDGARGVACSRRWRRRSMRRRRACWTRWASRSCEAPAAGCCGALPFHLDYQDEALAYVKANIDAWWPHVEAGAEAIVITASGCGTMVKDYGHLLRDDPAYAAKAARISALAKDVSEVVAAQREALAALLGAVARPRSSARGVPVALQPAARPEDQRRGGGAAARRGVHAHARWPTRTSAAARPAPTRSCSPTSREQPRGHKVQALDPARPPSSRRPTSAASRTSPPPVPVRHWIELVDDALRADRDRDSPY